MDHSIRHDQQCMSGHISDIVRDRAAAAMRWPAAACPMSRMRNRLNSSRSRKWHPRLPSDLAPLPLPAAVPIFGWFDI